MKKKRKKRVGRIEFKYVKKSTLSSHKRGKMQQKKWRQKNVKIK